MNKDFTLTLTEQEVNVVLGALNELPIKTGLATLEKILQQARQQANAPEEAPTAE